MSEPRAGATPERPRQVTLAGWLIVGGSIGVVLTVFSQVGSLHSLDTTRAIEQALSEPPAAGLGITVSEARLALRVSAMVAGACAAAAAILGWQVLRRSRPARVALAVLAVPLFVTGVASGGLLSSIVVAAAVMLWLQPARDWFDGRTPAAAAGRRGQAERSAPPAPSGPVPPRAEGRDQPPAHPTPWAASPVAPPPAPSAGAASPQPWAPPRRPAQVVWACVLTWAGSGLVALLMALSAAVLGLAPDSLLDEVARDNPRLVDQGIALDDVRVAAVVAAVLAVLWCGAASVLAGFVWARRSWAQLALLISAATAAVLCLLGVLLNPLLLVPLATCAATVVLLARGEVRRWLQGP